VIKNWNQYTKVLEENKPVDADSTVTQDLENRNVDLEQIKTEVQNITNQAQQISTSTNLEEIVTNVEKTINTYSNNTDSYITLALTYFKTIADKRTIELKLEQYKNQIPKLQQELQAKINELNNEIQNAQTAATNTETNV